MRSAFPAFLVALVAPLVAAIPYPAATSGTTPAYITAAMNDTARKDDAANDARRKGAEVATFAGVKPGDKVAELIPGGGYWTRVFSGIVGAKGHVYTIWPHGMDQY